MPNSGTIISYNSRLLGCAGKCWFEEGGGGGWGEALPYNLCCFSHPFRCAEQSLVVFLRERFRAAARRHVVGLFFFSLNKNGGQVFTHQVIK